MNRNFERVIDSFPAIARLLTCLLFFLVPLVFFKTWMSPFISSKLPLFYIFSALAFSLIAVYLIFRSDYRPTKKQLLPLLPVALLVASLGLSAFLATLKGLAFWSTPERGDGWFFFLHLFLLIFTVFVLILKDQSGVYKRNIILATLGSAGVVAVSVWFGNEGLNLGGKILSGSQGGGLLGNSSIAATYLLFAVFLGLVVIFYRGMFNKGIRRFAFIVIILIALSPVFVNFDLWRLAISLKSIFASPEVLLGSGRGAALGIALGVVIALALRMIYAPKKIFKIIGIGIVVASIIGLLSFFVSIQKVGSPMQAVFEEQAGTNRLIFWNIARGAIAEKPIFGWGLENFRVPFHRNFDPALLRAEESSEPWTDRAHNIFYDMAVAGGYVGLSLFFVVIGSLAWGIYSAGKRGLISTWGAAFFLGGVYAYLFQGIFVFDTIFSYLMLGLFYAFIFGLQREEQEKIEKKVSMPFKIFISGLLFAAALASIIFIAIPPARAASLFGKIIATPLLERTALWTRVLESPSVLEQGAGLARLALYVETEYGKRRSEILSPGNEAIRQGFTQDFQIIREVMDKSATLQRAHNNGAVMYMTLNTTARIYNSSILLSGTKDEKSTERAEYYSQESLRESPTNPQGYWIMAQMLILQNKIREADEMLEKAIVLDPYNQQSHRISIQVASSVGDKRITAFRILRAKQYIPDFTPS